MARPVILLADHPALDRGLATVGRHVAAGLHECGQWDVHYLGRSLDGDSAGSVSYSTYAARTTGADNLGQLSLPEIVRRLLPRLPDCAAVLPLIAIGPVGQLVSPI